MSMAMNGPSMPSSTPGAGHDHGNSADQGTGMDHSHGHGDGGMAMGGCKISMLWNWNTIDTCFIAESWHVRTTAMFAGSCIGVILLVILLEALRRVGKEYDRSIVQRSTRLRSNIPPTDAAAPGNSPRGSQAGDSKTPGVVAAFRGSAAVSVRPTILQQAIRALLHTMQFAVAYFVMLLAMYYNGYFIICIFIGAYIGSFIFHWESLASFGNDEQTRAGENPTVCCG